MSQDGEECNGHVRICQDLWYKISPYFDLPFTNHIKSTFTALLTMDFVKVQLWLNISPALQLLSKCD